MEKARLNNNKPNGTTPSYEDIDALKAEIKAAIQNLNPVQKKAMQTKLKEAGLPIQYNKENDEETLAKILSIVSE